MKMHYPLCPGGRVVEVEGATQADLFRELSGAVEVFGETHCGCCGGDAIVPIARVAEGYEFFEWACTDPNCGARLSMGVRKDQPGRLFPNRKLDAQGKPDWKNGERGDHNGWTRYHGPGTEAPPTPAPTKREPAAAAPSAPHTPQPQRREVTGAERRAAGTVTSTVQSPGYVPPTRAAAGAPISADQWADIQTALKSRMISPAAFLRRFGYAQPRDIKAADYDELIEAARNPDADLLAEQRAIARSAGAVAAGQGGRR